VSAALLAVGLSLCCGSVAGLVGVVAREVWRR
jgi:hypothetical protein